MIAIFVALLAALTGCTTVGTSDVTTSTAPTVKTECGINQTGIDKRIHSCAALSESGKITKQGVRWDLVTRRNDPASSYGGTYEVWKDQKTGLLWGGWLNQEFSQYEAVTLDAKGKVLRELACPSGDGVRANADIQEEKFALPTNLEFQVAESDGIREVLFYMPKALGNLYWTASANPENPDFRALFNAFNGGVVYLSARWREEVMCVGRGSTPPSAEFSGSTSAKKLAKIPCSDWEGGGSDYCGYTSPRCSSFMKPRACVHAPIYGCINYSSCLPMELIKIDRVTHNDHGNKFYDVEAYTATTKAYGDFTFFNLFNESAYFSSDELDNDRGVYPHPQRTKAFGSLEECLKQCGHGPVD